MLYIFKPRCLAIFRQRAPKIAIFRDLGTWATRKHNESMELGENWLQYASNRGTWSTSVTNSAFWLLIVATPMSDMPIKTTAHARTRLSCACSIEQISLGLNPSVAFAMHHCSTSSSYTISCTSLVPRHSHIFNGVPGDEDIVMYMHFVNCEPFLIDIQH
jgi:hypothetical protein